MKGIILASLLLLVIAAQYEKEKDILILNDNNFEQALKEFPTLVINFYAPWCRVSKSLLPEYVKVAEDLKKTGATCAKIDATQNKKAAARASVLRYPSLKLFHNDKFTDYMGDNTAEKIAQFMRKEILPAVKPLLTLEEIEKFREENKAVIMYFGNDSKDLIVLETLAREHEHYIFGSCYNKEVFEKLKTSEGKVVIFKQFDELRNDYPKEKITAEDVMSFVSKHANPTVMSFDMNTAKILFGEGSNGLFFYRDANDTRTEELDKMVTSLGEKLRGRIYIIITGIKDGFAEQLAEHFGLKDEDLPFIAIQEMKNNRNFRMKGDITEANILKFVQDWEEGKLKAYVKSEDIPTEQPDSVYKIVGNSFADVVLKSEKSVLLKFYAPWCGHCKQLAPIYKQLADKYKEDKTMLIAEVDATQNDVEGVKIEGYPTILFWKGDRKNEEPVTYEGGNTLEALEEFIKEQFNPSAKAAGTDTAKKKKAEKKKAEEEEEEEEDLLHEDL